MDCFIVLAGPGKDWLNGSALLVMNGMGNMMNWMMGGMMAYGAVFSVLLLIVLALLAVWLFQQVRGRRVA
ncbi:MAG TPA: hypothetical protein VNM48_07525 [Chloroflexota bacterium]|nr:hypothetical protein [Chloroflexota bacterium]